jgi:outer membrane protein OmpA-like peptidoglycan-associated protein
MSQPTTPLAGAPFEVAKRLGEYKRIVRETTVIAAALLGGVELFNALHSEMSHSALLEVLFATDFLVIVALAAYAHGSCTWQIDVIESLKERRRLSDATTMANANRISEGVVETDLKYAKLLYGYAVDLTVVGAVILGAAAWAPAWYPGSSYVSEWYSKRGSRHPTLIVCPASACAGNAAGSIPIPPVGISAPTPPVTASSQTPSVTLSRTIFFGRRNNIRIPAAGNQQLADLKEFYHQQNDYHIEIRGTADASGSERYNVWLSWRRANAVQSALVARGIDPWRIQLTPRGSADAHQGAGLSQRHAEARVTCKPSPP